MHVSKLNVSSPLAGKSANCTDINTQRSRPLQKYLNSGRALAQSSSSGSNLSSQRSKDPQPASWDLKHLDTLSDEAFKALPEPIQRRITAQYRKYGRKSARSMKVQTSSRGSTSLNSASGKKNPHNKDRRREIQNERKAKRWAKQKGRLSRDFFASKPSASQPSLRSQTGPVVTSESKTLSDVFRRGSTARQFVTAIAAEATFENPNMARIISAFEAFNFSRDESHVLHRISEEINDLFSHLSTTLDTDGLSQKLDTLEAQLHGSAFDALLDACEAFLEQAPKANEKSRPEESDSAKYRSTTRTHKPRIHCSALRPQLFDIFKRIPALLFLLSVLPYLVAAGSNEPNVSNSTSCHHNGTLTAAAILDIKKTCLEIVPPRKYPIPQNFKFPELKLALNWNSSIYSEAAQNMTHHLFHAANNILATTPENAPGKLALLTSITRCKQVVDQYNASSYWKNIAPHIDKNICGFSQSLHDRLGISGNASNTSSLTTTLRYQSAVVTSKLQEFVYKLVQSRDIHIIEGGLKSYIEVFNGYLEALRSWDGEGKNHTKALLEYCEASIGSKVRKACSFEQGDPSEDCKNANSTANLETTALYIVSGALLTAMAIQTAWNGFQKGLQRSSRVAPEGNPEFEYVVNPGDVSRSC